MRLEVVIDGMLAVHAKHAVFAALAGVPGLTSAQVELGRAELEFEAGITAEAARGAVASAIEAAGFTLAALRPLPRALPLL